MGTELISIPGRSLLPHQQQYSLTCGGVLCESMQDPKILQLIYDICLKKWPAPSPAKDSRGRVGGSVTDGVICGVDRGSSFLKGSETTSWLFREKCGFSSRKQLGRVSVCLL